MENNKLEEIIAIALDDFDRFKDDHEREFYLNVIRQLPEVTMKEYYEVILNRCLTKLSHLYEIRNNYRAKEQQFSDTYKDISNIINNVTRISMFVEELIKIDDGKKTEQEKHIKSITNGQEDKKLHKTNSNKLQFKGSLQSFGYIVSELIDKGYLQAPTRNGKNNTSEISRQFLNHFEFIDRAEQPKVEDIRKTLFTENRLSADKQSLFKIPNSNTINTD